MGKICITCGEQCGPKSLICQVCYQKQYYEKHKERQRLKKKAYYIANKDSIDKKCKEYVKNNKQKVLSKNRKHYKNNKSKILSYQKSIRNTPKRKFGQAVKSAKERNLTWNIDFDTYCLLISRSCHYCNKDLSDFGGSSLDRKDNKVGYILTNVLPCCGICNNIRNNFLSVEEMEVAMRAVVEYRNGHKRLKSIE